MRDLIFLILLLALFSCSRNGRQPIDPNKVIIEAVGLRFNDLNQEEKKGLSNYFIDCCCYPENWNEGGNCIKKEEAYYVKSKINNDLLASLSESNKFDLEFLINSNPKSLYGKTSNRWEFLDEFGNAICETSRFEGHNSFNLTRNDTIDEIIIGPLPVKPKKMIITILDSKYYKGITPIIEINY